MANIIHQIEPAAFATTIIGTIWAIEEGLNNLAKDALKNFNIKVLRTIQSSYDQTDLLRPLLQKNYDMSDISVTLLCDMMVSTFNISSIFLWIAIKVAIVAQHFHFSIAKMQCLFLANFSLRCHAMLYDYQTIKKSHAASRTYDVEWSELTVKMAIRELRHPDLFGDDLLTILYEVARFKSGPLACKLPLNDGCDKDKKYGDKPSLSELLVAAFALYHVEGSQVVENHHINVLGQAKVMFECVDVLYPSFVTVNLAINEILLQFSVNATAQCQQQQYDDDDDSKDGAWDAAYLIQYAIATNNQWLLSASTTCLDDMVKYSHSCVGNDLKDMAYAAGCAIAISHHGKANTVVQSSYYQDWIRTNFSHKARRLPWCQHHPAVRTCHCWLTPFLIMDPETALRLYDSHVERNIIVVAKDEDEGVRILESGTGAATNVVRFSSQSGMITNSTPCQRNNRIIVVGTTTKKS